MENGLLIMLILFGFSLLIRFIYCTHRSKKNFRESSSENISHLLFGLFLIAFSLFVYMYNLSDEFFYIYGKIIPFLFWPIVFGLLLWSYNRYFEIEKENIEKMAENLKQLKNNKPPTHTFKFIRRWQVNLIKDHGYKKGALRFSIYILLFLIIFFLIFSIITFGSKFYIALYFYLPTILAMSFLSYIDRKKFFKKVVSINIENS